MRIGLIDVDGHNFPNLALMKISAYHMAIGDTVEWCFPLDHYDIVYQAKVFDETYSPDIDWIPQADKIIKGGTGYGLDNKLPDEIGKQWRLELEAVCTFNTSFDCPFCGNTVYVWDIGVEETAFVTCDECERQIAVKGKAV